MVFLTILMQHTRIEDLRAKTIVLLNECDKNLRSIGSNTTVCKVLQKLTEVIDLLNKMEDKPTQFIVPVPRTITVAQFLSMPSNYLRVMSDGKSHIVTNDGKHKLTFHYSLPKNLVFDSKLTLPISSFNSFKELDKLRLDFRQRLEKEVQLRDSGLDH